MNEATIIQLIQDLQIATTIDEIAYVFTKEQYVLIGKQDEGIVPVNLNQETTPKVFPSSVLVEVHIQTGVLQTTIQFSVKTNMYTFEIATGIFSKQAKQLKKLIRLFKLK